MAYFYEIRSADNTLLRRDGGFANQGTAKEAARADAKKMKSAPKPGRAAQPLQQEKVFRVLAAGEGRISPSFERTVSLPPPPKYS